MHCTIVNFRATYLEGIFIDAYICRPWATQRGIQDVMNVVPDAEAKRAVFESMSGTDKKDTDEMCRAYQGMRMRAQVNPDIRGPYVFHTREPLDDKFLVAWAKENVFKKPRRAATI
jgi:hypothetical protein